MSINGSFLSLHSARFKAGAARTASGEGSPTGSVIFLGGTDADYPISGIPERRKTECHWLAAWKDEAEVDRFLASPTAHLPRLGEADNVWSLKLAPYMQRGADVLPLVPNSTRPEADEPIVIITSIGTYSGEADAIAASQRASQARESLLRADGLMHELLLVPYPPWATDLFTVTMWRSERAAQAWAYRTDAHRSAMDFYKTTGEKPRVSFTRCRICASAGERQPRDLVGGSG